MNNNYIEISIFCNPETSEMITAMISEFPFEMFQENEKGTKAYIRESDFSEDIIDYLHDLKGNFDFQYEKKVVEGKNWNIEWESNFHSIVIENFCGIRADFHEPIENVEYELVINPKMAFGTGHHETTHLAISFMKEIDFSGKKVLDFGSGTGVLSFLASKLKAKEIIAIDNEVPAYESTIENAEINDVKNLKTIYGVLSDVEEDEFDIILANINRNVITSALDLLYKKLNPSGILVTSGFLINDKKIIFESLAKHSFFVLEEKTKGDWLCLKLTK